MKKYAVLRIKGKQYKVTEGEEFRVDKLDSREPEIDVLLLADEGKLKLGKPVIKGMKPKIKIVTESEKGTKIDVFKYKAKSRYRKRIGFRPVYTKLLVERPE